MTLEELYLSVKAVVDYNWSVEFRDAKENGLDGHIMNHLIALAGFIGEPINAIQLAELKGDQ